MNLPPAFQFFRPGWWATHAVAFVLVGGAGFAAGVHRDAHHGAHPDAPRDAHDGAHGDAHRGAHADEHHDTHPAAAANPSDPSNPVQREMQLLVAALATGPASFAAGDLVPLHHQLHSVHAAREKTDEALEHGAYRLPKNADKLERFRQLDEQFHAVLEQLAEHAAKNELGPAAAAYGQVLGACNGCHSEFRGP